MHKSINSINSFKSINFHTITISYFVDYDVQPLVKEIPSYIKDSSDFVNKINNFKVAGNSFLGNMDVKPLHTNIPNNKGIAAVIKEKQQLHKENCSHKKRQHS